MFGFCNVLVFVWLGFLCVGVSMCGFGNALVCVCVGFVMCWCVYVWDYLMCGCV